MGKVQGRPSGWDGRCDCPNLGAWTPEVSVCSNVAKLLGAGLLPALLQGDH